MKNFGLKTNKLHRIIAATICMVMLLGLVFQVTLFSAPEGEEKQAEQAVTRVADASTINSWQEYFGDDKGTLNAGRIWSDKTVVDGDIELKSLDDTEVSVVERTQGSDNFMVGLSALGSNKSVTGESKLPMDVVFVLDISQSMLKGGKIQELVKAVNKSISSILELNEENRIGVILYSGNTDGGLSSIDTATCPLPLDYYQNTVQQDTYFSLKNDSDGELIIQVADGVINSNGQNVGHGERMVFGYTYIQNGLMLAFEQLRSNSSEQKKERVPVIALMSDGAPTTVTTNYTVREDSTIGTGNYTDIRMTFLTQLTAAWIKEQLRLSYEEAPLFYSVGLLAGEDKDYEYANMVLNPSEKTDDELDEWWRIFTDATKGENVILTPKQMEKINPEESDTIIVKKEDATLGTSDTTIKRYYVDKFFDVNDTTTLEEAFQGIVDEIRMQSEYYPTDTDKDNPNHSGHLVFEDVVGEYMRVESVKGVMYGGKLYNGSGFAKKVSQDDSMEEEETREFLNVLMEQLQIDSESSAQSLLDNAKAIGEISYSSDSEFSNYIGWYSDLDGNYLDAYQNNEEKPDGAVYFNKSYFYFGDVSNTMSGNNNIMYLEVQVMQSIDTGEEIVRFVIPGSLIPVVKYDVTKKTDEHENVIIKTDRKLADPVHLFYEIGLDEEINKYDLSKVKEGYQYYEDDSPLYRKWKFYSNAWKEGEAQTTLEFTPSEENECYYYKTDATIYTKVKENPVKYEEYKGNELDKNKTYYIKNTVYNLFGEMDEKYFELNEESLDKAEQNFEGSGTWIIPKGTFKYEAIEQVNKKTNQTSTVQYLEKSSLQNVFDTYEEENAKFSIMRGHGNNASIGIEQGKIVVTKQVKNFYDGTDGGEKHDKETTEFEFELSGDSVQQFVLKSTESKSIWLPIGSVVEAKEIGEIADRYQTNVSVNGKTIEGTKESGKITISNKKISDVVFINNYDPPKTDLILYKADENKRALGGAVFHLYKLECDNTDSEHIESEHNQVLSERDQPQIIQDKNSCWRLVGEAISSKTSGRMVFKEVWNSNEILYLTKGTYRLIETKAPEGYIKPVGQWNVDIVPSGDEPYIFREIVGKNGEKPPAIYISEGFYTVTNYKPINPPVTGGRGIDRFLILGVIVAVSGLMITVHLVLQRKRGKL